MTEAVIVYRSSSTADDSSGEPIPGTQTTTEYDCIVWQTSSEEIDQLGGDPLKTHFTVSFPLEADVKRGDGVLVRGELCKIFGRPADWTDQFDGEELGIVAIAEQVV